MAKPTGGLLAFNARGSIAKTIVYSSWRGRQYVRQHVIPANPRSTSQVANRSMFTWLMEFWKGFPSNLQYTWTLYATGRPLTNRNAFLKFNLAALEGTPNLNQLTMSPGAKGGVPLVSLTLTAGAGSVGAVAVPPTPPPGWTLAQVVFVGFADATPPGDPIPQVVELVDTSSPYSVSFTGLTAGDLFHVNAWPVWTKADGNPATGTDLGHTATPT